MGFCTPLSTMRFPDSDMQQCSQTWLCLCSCEGYQVEVDTVRSCHELFGDCYCILHEASKLQR